VSFSVCDYQTMSVAWCRGQAVFAVLSPCHASSMSLTLASGLCRLMHHEAGTCRLCLFVMPYVDIVASAYAMSLLVYLHNVCRAAAVRT
jgi:hypothetical protein